MPSRPSLPLRIGLIGAGEVSQVIHLPTLLLLPHLFRVTGIADVSSSACAHAASKFHIPRTFASAAELCADEETDVVLIASADEYHAEQAVEAARNGKHVFVEKPMALTRNDFEKVEKARKEYDVHISVGYMRRFAPAFLEFKRLLAESGPIQYAVVRDLIGPNSIFVSQSGTFPQKFTDVSAALAAERASLAASMSRSFLGEAKSQSPRLVAVHRLLGSLGSHDLSLMREALGGVPTRCQSAWANKEGDFMGATFVYERPEGEFNVSYETGIHNVGVFDAFIEVFTRDRVLKIQYDTPYVKGLPIVLSVREADPAIPGSYQERLVRPTFKDAYTAEFEALAEAITRGEELKTGPLDAIQDVDIWEMMMEHL